MALESSFIVKEILTEPNIPTYLEGNSHEHSIGVVLNFINAKLI